MACEEAEQALQFITILNKISYAYSFTSNVLVVLKVYIHKEI